MVGCYSANFGGRMIVNFKQSQCEKCLFRLKKSPEWAGVDDLGYRHYYVCEHYVQTEAAIHPREEVLLHNG
jgi:hypothetical protein